jgi:predicted DNA-binding protein
MNNLGLRWRWSADKRDRKYTIRVGTELQERIKAFSAAQSDVRMSTSEALRLLVERGLEMWESAAPRGQQKE